MNIKELLDKKSKISNNLKLITQEKEKRLHYLLKMYQSNENKQFIQAIQDDINNEINIFSKTEETMISEINEIDMQINNLNVENESKSMNINMNLNNLTLNFSNIFPINNTNPSFQAQENQNNIMNDYLTSLIFQNNNLNFENWNEKIVNQAIFNIKMNDYFNKIKFLQDNYFDINNNQIQTKDSFFNYHTPEFYKVDNEKNNDNEDIKKQKRKAELINNLKNIKDGAQAQIPSQMKYDKSNYFSNLLFNNFNKLQSTNIVENSNNSNSLFNFNNDPNSNLNRKNFYFKSGDQNYFNTDMSMIMNNTLEKYNRSYNNYMNSNFSETLSDINTKELYNDYMKSKCKQSISKNVNQNDRKKITKQLLEKHVGMNLDDNLFSTDTPYRNKSHYEEQNIIKKPIDNKTYSTEVSFYFRGTKLNPLRCH